MTEREDGERAVTVLGKYSTTLVPVGVDADGNLVILIKGDYEGTPTTVAIDSEGRLSAYIVDPEDVWGVQEQMGLSGLAACLGSVKRFDGRGTVLTVDTFEAGLQRWVSSTGSASSTVTLSASEAAHGGYSAMLTAAGEIGGLAAIAIEIPYPALSVIGFEFHVYLPAAFSTFTLGVYKYDGTNVHYGGIRYVQATTKLQYRDSAGAWQDYRTGITLHGLTRVFGAWKLVVDFDDDLYVRSLVNNYYNDLDAYAIRSTADASTPRLRFLLELAGNDSDEAIAYVDTVVVTQNEPANP